MIFAIRRRFSDTCGNEELSCPFRYIEADSIKEVEEVYPRGFLVGYEIEETIQWVRIEKELKNG